MGADEYAVSVLRDLEEQLIQNLGTVQNGIGKLERDYSGRVQDE
jgi:hypothetical protein